MARRWLFRGPEAEIDEHTGKPIPDAICFDYSDGDTRYVLTYYARRPS